MGAYHIIYDSYLRDRVVRRSVLSHYNDCNVLSMHALIGGFSDEGALWADEMIAVIDENLRVAYEFFTSELSGIKLMRPQGTYMLYLDCADWCRDHGVPIGQLQARGVRCGVVWQNGEAFMYPDTIRMNLALPLSLEKEALRRLKEYVFI